MAQVSRLTAILNGYVTGVDLTTSDLVTNSVWVGGTGSSPSVQVTPSLLDSFLTSITAGSGISVTGSAPSQTVAVDSTVIRTSGVNAFAADQSMGNNNLTDAASIQLAGSTSGTLIQEANASTTSYTVKWPGAQASGYLQNDGSGNLSWASASVGANTALSNLSAVAINTSLLPGVDDSINIGSASHSWAGANIHTLADGSAVTSIDAYNRLLEDSSGLTSVNYGTSALIDASSSTQLSWSASGVEFNQLTASTVPYLNSSSVLVSSVVTPTQLGYLSGASGTTGTGSIAFSASPTFTGTLSAAAASLSAALNMNSNKINNLAPGVAGTDAINFNQLQNAMAGIQWRPEVNLYDNVDTTPPATTATQIDGVTVTNGMRVLFVNLASGNNEVYTAAVVSTAITWTAALDNDRSSAAPVTGDSILVLSGTTYSESAWNYNGTAWVQFNGANQVQPGSALSKTGNTLNVQYDNSTIGLNGSNQLFVPTSGITATQLATGSVTIAKLGTITDGVTLDQSGSGSSLEIKSGGVGTTQLASAAVTAAKLGSVSDGITIDQSGSGSTLEVIQAPKIANTFTAGVSFAANTSFIVRWAQPGNSETAGTVYKADNSSGSTNAYAIGIALSSTSVSASGSIKVVSSGSFTLGSSDASFTSGQVGLPVFLTTSGAFSITAPTSAGTAVTRIGIVQSTTSIWIQPVFVSVN